VADTGVRWRWPLKNHLSPRGWWKYDEEGELGDSLAKREKERARADQGDGRGIREGGGNITVRCGAKRVRDAETGWRGSASLVESGKASEATTHSSLRPREPCQPHIPCVASFSIARSEYIFVLSGHTRAFSM